MSENLNSCGNAGHIELHEYQLKQLQEAKEDHVKRLNKLEADSEKMFGEIKLLKNEVSSVKSDISELKAVTLESRVDLQKKFEGLLGKVLDAQREQDTKQQENFNQLIGLIRDGNNNKTEISGKKIALFGTIGGGVIAIILKIFEFAASMIDKIN